MHRTPYLSALAYLSWLLLSPSAQAEAASELALQCVAPPEWLPDPEISAALRRAVAGNGDATDRVFIEADDFEGLRGQYLSYRGNVNLQYNDVLIETEQAEYHEERSEFIARGGLIYQDSYVAVRGESITGNSLTNEARITDLDYYLQDTAARGAAAELYIEERDDMRSLTFNDSSFTTCPGDRPVWEIRASQISLNEEEGWGLARGAQLRLLNVPVLYVPRFSFPVTDERKSGLLYPTIRSSSRTGMDVEIPYYFNLAPNYDATLAPRYMSERGLMGTAEGRYLSERHRGQINIEYLHRDNYRDDDSNRYYWRVEQEAHYNHNWSTYIDASAVSDVNYFNDFGSQFANRADSHIYRRGQANYFSDYWQAQLQVEDFQMLGPYQSPYRTLPRLSVWYDTGMPVRQGFQANWHSELTYFDRQDGWPEHATRFHTEPGVMYHMRYPGWEWSAEGRMLLTHYEQEQFEDDVLVRRSISRALPEFRWHGQINLERPFTVAGYNGTQTLQPQLQFLYTPYRDQRYIGIYDSVPLQDDYNGLFRKRRFSGLDRIADANQMTVGATTSIFNQRAEELMRLSLGQTFYFEDSRTQLFDQSTQITDNSSEIAAELDFRISSRWFLSSSVQYDNQLNQMQKSRSAVEYRKDESNLVQFNFRQVRGLIGSQTDVEQVGTLAAWELSSNWSVAGHWYRDLRNSSTLDANLGVQYSSCCWAVRVSAYRRIDRNFEGVQPNQTLVPAEFDNGISLQFVITGLSADSSSLSGMLQQGIFGYRRPFYLSN